MGILVALNSLWVLMLFQNIGHGSAFDCISECFGEVSDSLDSEITCEMLHRATSCHDNNTEACSAAHPLQLSFNLNSIRTKLQARNCDPVVATVPPTAATASQPPAVTCPTVPIQVTGEHLMAAADITPEGTIPSSCQVTGTAPVSHCSLFMHSHLRPFHFRAAPKSIQTCSLPGAWQLFRHQDLQIDVEGAAEQPTSMHTQLTKVMVTFRGLGSCNPVTRSYIVYNTSPLPRSFACSTEPHNNTDSPLQLHLSENGSVVTLLATWLNSTIIIRQMEGFLAVTLKVTGFMAFESEGLCTGCPNHQYVDALSYSDSNTLRQNCESERYAALFNCFFVTANSDDLMNVVNISYIDACVYSMLKAGSSYVKMMMEALAEDAKLLTDHGTVPMRPQVLPVSPGPIPIPSPDACHTVNIIDTTTDAILPSPSVDISDITTDAEMPTASPPSSETFDTNEPVLAISGARSLPLATICLLFICWVTHVIYIP